MPVDSGPLTPAQRARLAHARAAEALAQDLADRAEALATRQLLGGTVSEREATTLALADLQRTVAYLAAQRPHVPRVLPENLLAQCRSQVWESQPQAEGQQPTVWHVRLPVPPWLPGAAPHPLVIADEGTDLHQLQAEQRRARERARALLVSYLDPQQKAEYEQHGWFVVTGASGRRYKLCTGMVLSLRPDGRHERQLCVVFAEGYKDLPVEDLVLAQFLL